MHDIVVREAMRVKSHLNFGYTAMHFEFATNGSRTSCVTIAMVAIFGVLCSQTCAR